MQDIFDQAQIAYDKGDFKRARVLYAQCITANTDDEITKLAIFMVTLLLIQEDQFQQALANYNLLNDQPINTSKLPKKLHKYSQSDLLQNATIDRLNKLSSDDFDLAGYSFNGEAFKKVLQTLKKNPKISIIRLSNNPLNEDEVNNLLDVLLARNNLTEIDLRGLPINHAATVKLRKLIAKNAKQTPTDNATTIKLSHYLIGDRDLVSLMRALGLVTEKKICIEVDDGQKSTLLSSRAISREKIQQQNKHVSQRLAELAYTFIDTSSSSDETENSTTTLIYDTQGDVIGHLTEQDGRLIVKIMQGKKLVVDSLKPFFPCKFLFIHAPEAIVEFKDHLSVPGSIVINCAACKINSTAAIQTPEMIINAKTDLYVAGKIHTDNLNVDSNNSILLDGNSELVVTKSQLLAGKIECKGKLSCDIFNANGDNVNLAGELTPRSIDHTKISTPVTLSVQAKALQIDGKIKTANGLSCKVDDLFVHGRAKIFSGTSQQVSSKSLQHKSVINCTRKCYFEEGSEISSQVPLCVETQDLSLYGILQSNHTIKLVVNGSGQIHDSGKISADEHIILEGSHCWNSGEIHAKGLLDIAFDKFFINGLSDDVDPFKVFKQGKLLGKLSGKNVTVTSGFFLDILANITTENNIEINSLVELSIGLTNTQHVNSSSLIGINLGATITAAKSIESIINFVHKIAKSVSSDKSLKSIVQEYYDTVDNKTLAMSGVTYALRIASIAAKLLNIFAPAIGVPANIILNSINTLFQLALNGVTLAQEVGKLIAHYKQGEVIRACHIYRLILKIKNIGMSFSSVASTWKALPSSIQHMPENIQNSHEGIASLAPNLATLFGGSVSQQSVLQIDGLNVTVSSLYNSTSAIHLSAFQNTIAGLQFDNSLLSRNESCNVLAAIRNIATQEFKESAGHQIIDTETLTAKNIEMGGQTVTNHLTVVANNFNQDGSLQAQNAVLNSHEVFFEGKVAINSGAILSNHLNTTESSHTALTNVYVKSDESNFQGNATLQNVTMEASAKIDFEATSQTQMQDSHFKAQQINHQKNSHLDSVTSSEEANKITFQGKSHLDHSFTNGKEMTFSG